MDSITFGLNRIISPDLSMEKFFELADSMGIKDIELRNDLGGSIYDNISNNELNILKERYNINIATVNALQQFNKPGDLNDRVLELEQLLKEAEIFGTKAIVLCPLNDPEDKRDYDKSLTDTVNALKTYGPLFKKYNIMGFVEPLGFSICTLRTKKKAVQAIELSGYSECYKLVHDTFHHYLSGEIEFFPEYTGLVHISGVVDKIAKEDINDDHRILINSNDIMDNKQQIQTLHNRGCNAIFSFEPFSKKVQSMDSNTLKTEIKKSIQFLTN